MAPVEVDDTNEHDNERIGVVYTQRCRVVYIGVLPAVDRVDNVGIASIWWGRHRY